MSRYRAPNPPLKTIVIKKSREAFELIVIGTDRTPESTESNITTLYVVFSVIFLATRLSRAVGMCLFPILLLLVISISTRNQQLKRPLLTFDLTGDLAWIFCCRPSCMQNYPKLRLSVKVRILCCVPQAPLFEVDVC